MTDDDLKQWAAQWRRSDTRDVEMLSRIRATRRRDMVLTALEGALYALALAAGIFIAANAQTALEWVSAITLIVVMPTSFVLLIRIRRPTWGAPGTGPEATARYALKRIQATLKAVDLFEWSARLLTLFVLVLWGLALSGADERFDFVLLYTAVAVPAIVGAIMWARWRRKRLAAQEERCLAIIAEFEERTGGTDPA